MMAKTKCALGKKGRRDKEWYDGKKWRIYCYGYIDPMYDEPLPECRNCPEHVDKSQDDFDKWRNSHEIS